MLLLRDRLGNTNRRNGRVPNLWLGVLGWWRVATLLVMHAEPRTAFIHFQRVSIHAKRLLNLGNKKQLGRARDTWNVIHRVQNSRQCDCGGWIRNEKEIHDTEFRQESGQLEGRMTGIQRNGGEREQVQKVSRKTK